MSILVTGAAGFIGFHLCHKLIQEGHELIGIDNVNDYYDQRLKFSRLNLLKTAVAAEHQGTFEFIKCNISGPTALSSVFAKHNPTVVVNLAAQAGVRYSIHNPSAYIESNQLVLPISLNVADTLMFEIFYMLVALFMAEMKNILFLKMTL